MYGKGNANPLEGLVDKALIYKEIMKEHDLKDYQYCIVDLLRRGYDKNLDLCRCTQQDLANKMFITPSLINYHIKPMLRKGTIKKETGGLRILDKNLFEDLSNLSGRGYFMQVSFSFNNEEEITLLQSRVLWTIFYCKICSSKEGITIDSLCKTMGIERSTMSDCINKLVERNLISHYKGTSDFGMELRVYEKLEALSFQSLAIPTPKFGRY